jgi:hypothetical protein
MPDLYFHSPAGESAGRHLRDRHRDLDGLVGRLPDAAQAGTMRRLVQVYDGGAIPTAPDKFYLTHPVELDGDETEGGTPSSSADTTQTIWCDVIGSKAVAGDLLIAHAIAGRWVAELRKTSSDTVTCTGCSVPNHNLTLQEGGTFGGFDVSGITVTLKHPPPPFALYYWQSDVGRYTFGSHLYWFFGMRCTSDPVNGNGWTIDYWESLDGISYGTKPYASTDSRSTAPTLIMTQDSISCGDPFSWNLHAGDIGGSWTWAVSS